MPGFGFGHGFGSAFSRLTDVPVGPDIGAPFMPSASWNGTAESGFASLPQGPARSTAKPVCRLLDAPRQTITGELVVGVFAAANNAGSLFSNLGLSHVNFYLEGSTVLVVAPTFRTFTRYDGSTYSVLGWWATLVKPEGKEGIGNLYVEAVPSDSAMQSRVIGPHAFLFYDNEFDHEYTVAANGSGDFTKMSDAFNAVRSDNAQRPRIRITDGGTYDFGNAVGGHIGDGYCTIEATQPVTFKQPAPALPFDFTRAQTRIDRLRYKGANITLDFAETLQFETDASEANHWFDGCRILQSRGGNDLWRGRPRNINPSLVDVGAYFTDCLITDVNDWGDKTPLARGNITQNTWADALQDARCAVANIIENHTSAFYYTNVDALSVQYTGAAATAKVTLNGSNGANRTLRLYENDVEVATFSILNSEQAFRDNTNYTIQNVVDFINARAGWSATLLDNTRFAAALTFPGSTNGKGFIKLDAKSAPLTLPTHFDIHSDIYQLPNLAAPRENVVFAFNRGWGIDAQNMLLVGSNGIRDAMFVSNAFYNNLGTLDEGLQTQLANAHSHVVVAHNSMPTQKITLRTDGSYAGDSYCLTANNAVRDLSDSGGGAAANVTIKDNHIDAGETDFPGAIGTTIGGTATSLYLGAASGDYSPTGDLLSNMKRPLWPADLFGTARAQFSPPGAVA